MIHGLDIGGSKIEIAVYARDLTLIERWRIVTPRDDYAMFIDAVTGLIDDADTRYGTSVAVGLGVPGVVDGEGRSLSANVSSATGRMVAADVAARIRRPVVTENDCRCFALSEATGGAGDRHDIVFGAILGTGAAGGLVVDRKLVRGSRGIAGEYGHLQLPVTLAQKYSLPNIRCGCGLPACFESYVAGPGVMRLARHFRAGATDVPALAMAWRRGDAAAVQTRNCMIDLLGAVFASVVMMVDPDVIVLGGGLSLLDDVVASLPSAIEQHLFDNFPAPAVVAAQFGDASGARGAAILALLQAGIQ